MGEGRGVRKEIHSPPGPTPLFTLPPKKWEKTNRERGKTEGRKSTNKECNEKKKKKRKSKERRE